VSSYFPSDFCILILLLRSLSHELHPNFSFFGILQPYMRGRAWLQVTSGKASPAFSNFIFPFLHLLGLALCPLLLAVFNDRSCFLPRSIILLALIFFFIVLAISDVLHTPGSCLSLDLLQTSRGIIDLLRDVLVWDLICAILVLSQTAAMAASSFRI